MTLTLTEDRPVVEVDDPHVLRSMLDAESNLVEVLQESLADLEMAAEDVGWEQVGHRAEQEFSRSGLSRIARNCRVMVLASPLVKRAVQLRIGYVWGQGVTVAARAASDEDGGQDVNAVVQAFWDDPSNQQSLTASSAHETNERALATEGNVFLALFTDPLTGRVQVRVTPWDEITDVVRNPDDRDDPWFYVREYEAREVRAFQPASGPMTSRLVARRVRVLHPAVGYRPQVRARSIDGMAVMWDAPILHIAVNRPAGWKWGVPDAYAALPWARAYDGFLGDWAGLVKALSRFAWRLTGDRKSRTQAAADKVRAVAAQGAQAGRLPVPPLAVGPGGPVGGVAAMGPGVGLEAIPKSGATIDAGSGKPLAAMVASATGVSVVDLLADPGTTGARAVAETLDKPIILEMGMRRELWSAVISTVLGYTIDQAVKAPRGALRGTIGREAGSTRETITLAGDTERTVTVDWPDLNELDPVALVTAIVAADATGKLPPVETMRLLLHALRVKDVDELIEAATDENGDWIDPDTTAGQAAVNAFRRGEDPARVVDPDQDPAT